MKNKNRKPGIQRRDFLRTSTLIVTGVALAYGTVGVPLLKSKRLLLRPPGALEEEKFLAACIKCGQCLQVCPPQVIKLAGILHGLAIGTPYITPREGGCILDAGLPCVLACPTGALDHSLSSPKNAKMGLAVISGPETCLSVLGINDLVFKMSILEKPSDGFNETKALREILEILAKRLNPEEDAVLRSRFKWQEEIKSGNPQKLNQISPENFQWLKDFIASSDLSPNFGVPES